jgi:hypothetical protein
MESPTDPSQSGSQGSSRTSPGEVEAHIAGAQTILRTLQEKIGEHPEIGAAITKLEMALNARGIQTGGLL